MNKIYNNNKWILIIFNNVYNIYNIIIDILI